jgi:ferrous iron transport protein B
MYLLFFFAINIGGAFQDFFELTTQAFIIKISTLFDHSNSGWFKILWREGLGKGISTIFAFIPVIGAMFFALAFLEDCGYMERAAFVVDRLMRIVGLPGKSFVSMIIGFGCNVPAIMGTRTLDNKRDRILAVMMSPFMSCGARLAIYTIFVAAFFPSGGQNIVFLLYLIGIGMAIITGLWLKRTLLPGEVAPLLLEMPKYQWPHWRSLWMHSWHRLHRFITNATKLILPVCVCMALLNNIYLSEKTSDKPEFSLLALTGQKIVPLFKPMGIEAENWPAAVGLLTGILAKEVVIGTLNSLYAQTEEETSLPFSLEEHLKIAAATIPQNFSDLLGSWYNPMGPVIPESFHPIAYGEMIKRFNGKANAFAYLLFVLLYFPCISATAAMTKEVQKGWTIFSICWTTGLAYAVAVFFYQCSTFTSHPWLSLGWILLLLLSLGGVFKAIAYYGKVYLPKIVPTPIILV